MDLMPGVFSFLLLASSAVSSLFFLRRRSGLSLSSRIPILLELSMVFFLAGLALLPTAVPFLFQRMLGHTISSDYVHPIRADGMRMTETWILARWWAPISKVLYAFVLLGIAWSLWNLRQAHDRKLNVLALCLGLLWVCAGIMANLKSFPF